MSDANSRITDPDTSADAAEFVRGARAREVEEKILKVLLEHPEGLTACEVNYILEMDRVTTSPRFAPMNRKGLIFDSRIRRKGLSNRPCIVWMAAHPGMELPTSACPRCAFECTGEKGARHCPECGWMEEFKPIQMQTFKNLSERMTVQKRKAIFDKFCMRCAELKGACTCHE